MYNRKCEKKLCLRLHWQTRKIFKLNIQNNMCVCASITKWRVRLHAKWNLSRANRYRTNEFNTQCVPFLVKPLRPLNSCYHTYSLAENLFDIWILMFFSCRAHLFRTKFMQFSLLIFINLSKNTFIHLSEWKKPINWCQCMKASS